VGAPQPKVKRGPPSEWEKRFTRHQGTAAGQTARDQNVVDALIAKAS